MVEVTTMYINQFLFGLEVAIYYLKGSSYVALNIRLSSRYLATGKLWFMIKYSTLRHTSGSEKSTETMLISFPKID